MLVSTEQRYVIKSKLTQLFSVNADILKKESPNHVYPTISIFKYFSIKLWIDVNPWCIPTRNLYIHTKGIFSEAPKSAD